MAGATAPPTTWAVYPDGLRIYRDGAQVGMTEWAAFGVLIYDLAKAMQGNR